MKKVIIKGKRVTSFVPPRCRKARLAIEDTEVDVTPAFVSDDDAPIVAIINGERRRDDHSVFRIYNGETYADLYHYEQKNGGYVRSDIEGYKQVIKTTLEFKRVVERDNWAVDRLERGEELMAGDYYVSLSGEERDEAVAKAVSDFIIIDGLAWVKHPLPIYSVIYSHWKGEPYRFASIVYPGKEIRNGGNWYNPIEFDMFHSEEKFDRNPFLNESGSLDIEGKTRLLLSEVSVEHRIEVLIPEAYKDIKPSLDSSNGKVKYLIDRRSDAIRELKNAEKKLNEVEKDLERAKSELDEASAYYDRILG